MVFWVSHCRFNRDYVTGLLWHFFGSYLICRWRMKSKLQYPHGEVCLERYITSLTYDSVISVWTFRIIHNLKFHIKKKKGKKKRKLCESSIWNKDTHCIWYVWVIRMQTARPYGYFYSCLNQLRGRSKKFCYSWLYMLMYTTYTRLQRVLAEEPLWARGKKKKENSIIKPFKRKLLKHL